MGSFVGNATIRCTGTLEHSKMTLTIILMTNVDMSGL